MDFVVAGFGLGAVIVLAGFVLRDLGPLCRCDRADGAGPRRRPAGASWAETCRAAGAAAAVGGSVVWLVTLVATVAAVGDAAGDAVVLVATVGAVAVVGVRVVALFRRYRRFAVAERALAVTGRRLSSAPVAEAAPTEPRPPARPPGPPDPAREPRSIDAPALGDELARAPEPTPVAEPEPALEPRPSLGALEEEAAFRSPLLTDLTGDHAAAPSAFRSGLFADLDVESSGAAPENGFRSGLLADITAEAPSPAAETARADATDRRPPTSSDPPPEGDGPVSAAGAPTEVPSDEHSAGETRPATVAASTATPGRSL